MDAAGVKEREHKIRLNLSELAFPGKQRSMPRKPWTWRKVTISADQASLERASALHRRVCLARTKSLSDRFVGAGAGDTSNSLPDNEIKAERHASRSPSLQAIPQSAGHTAVVVKVPSDHSCHVKAAALRDKAEKSSSTHCFYTKIPEPRKVSSPHLIDNRTKLAMFVNSMFSCEEIKCGQGSMLDVVFVPHDRGAASIRFPPLQPEQTCDGTAEERSPDGTTWSSASRNAAFVMLTQNEGTMQNMRHPKLVH